MKVISSYALVTGMLTLSVANPVWADDENGEAIEEIVVTAAPLGRSADELTQPVMVLGADQLLMRAAASIGETLANEPGMSSSYFGPVAGRPVIRGQAGPRISVLEGGISTLDVADLSPDHAVPIEPLFADAIEIIRGPATLLYGSAAAGGVVNVIDNRIPKQLSETGLSAALELRADTAANERAGALRLDGGNDLFAWHLDAFDRQSDDIDISGFATADPDERPEDEQKGTLLNSAGESSGYAGGATLFTDRGSFGLSVSRYESTYGLPKAEEEEEEGPPGTPPEPQIAPGPFIELEQTRVDLLATYQLDGLFESVKVRAGFNDYEHIEVEPNGEIGTRFLNEAWETRVELVHAPISGWRGALGLQLNDRDFSALGEEAFVTPTATTSSGFFLLEERSFEFGVIEIGARIEQLEHDPLSALPGYDETAISLATGINWDLDDNRDLRVNLSRSERHPDAAELYADGAHLATGLFEVGLFALGSDVTQEVSNNLDVSLHHHDDVRDWEISVFYNRINDYIFLQDTGAVEDGLPVAQYQQQNARFYGVEMELTQKLGGAQSPFEMRVFGDFVRGETAGENLPRVQPARLGLGLSWSTDDWMLQAESIFHAKQNRVSSFQTDSFTMLNLNAIRTIVTASDMRWDIFAKASNLLDEDARRSTSFLAANVPLPGIALQGGVRLRFR